MKLAGGFCPFSVQQDLTFIDTLLPFCSVTVGKAFLQIEIEPDAFDFVLGDYYYHRDGEDNETRVLLRELSVD